MPAMDSRWPRRAARLAVLCAAGLTAWARPACGEGASAKSRSETGPGWKWETNRYLGHWEASLAWPELARCWQRYGGDATEVASSRPPGQAQRSIPVRAFPRHADFDRRRLIATRPEPYPEQLAALARLESSGASTAERVLDAVHAYFLDHDYDALRDEVWNDEGRANIGRLESRAAIGETLELQTVHLHNKWRDGLSYVGLIFETGWDGGHGLGVLLHGDRIVQVGGADTAFNPSQWADGELQEPKTPWLR